MTQCQEQGAHSPALTGVVLPEGHDDGGVMAAMEVLKRRDAVPMPKAAVA